MLTEVRTDRQTETCYLEPGAKALAKNQISTELSNFTNLYSLLYIIKFYIPYNYQLNLHK